MIVQINLPDHLNIKLSKCSYFSFVQLIRRVMVINLWAEQLLLFNFMKVYWNNSHHLFFILRTQKRPFNWPWLGLLFSQQQQGFEKQLTPAEQAQMAYCMGLMNQHFWGKGADLESYISSHCSSPNAKHIPNSSTGEI